jgi:hypothetical protein
MDSTTALGEDEINVIIENDGFFTISDIRWWDRTEYPLVFKDIEFSGVKPSRYRQRTFTVYDCEKFIGFLSGISLTHRIMFVRHGYIYVTMSNDHQTNITGEIIEEFLKLYHRSFPTKKGS